MKPFLSIIVTFFCLSFYSQEPYYINYTINTGLPTNKIYSTFHDAKGFIWFATDVGVIKYDIKKFTLYITDSGLTDN